MTPRNVSPDFAEFFRAVSLAELQEKRLCNALCQLAAQDGADLNVLRGMYHAAMSIYAQDDAIHNLQRYLFIPQNLLVHFPTQDPRRHMSHFKWG